MKIKLSKTQWEEMGKKAGWTKTADVNPSPMGQMGQDVVSKLENWYQTGSGSMGRFNKYSRPSIRKEIVNLLMREVPGMSPDQINKAVNDWLSAKETGGQAIAV